uniref:Hydroxymethylglutaryl-CoA reductase (NADPH) n=1 Tax=Panagrolaimus sp. JU765 TaxID=591449 RepID=A0AC34QUL3_9BILA
MSSIEATQSTSNFAVDELNQLLADYSDSLRSIPDTPTGKSETETLESGFDQEEENADLLRLMIDGKIKHRQLETKVAHERAVELRRLYIEHEAKTQLTNLPYKNYDYHLVSGACCENPIGYMTIPVGCAGPLLIDNELVYLPLATTEGALVASINRGCKVLTESGGIKTAVLKDAMTRAPLIAFDDCEEAIRCYNWTQDPSNYPMLKESEEAIRCYNWTQDPTNYPMLKERFESTSRFAKLQRITPHYAASCVYLRFEASTGDAMGMNMISKASQAAMELIHQKFPSGKIALSGNLCIDKKAAAINWIEGRDCAATAENNG